METMYYTLTAREIAVEGAGVRQACGGSRQLVFVREAARSAVPAAGKVIDLFAWKEDHRQSEDEEPLCGGCGDVEDAADETADRTEERRGYSWNFRRARRCALSAELLSCAAVVAVMVVLVLKVLGTV